MILISNVPIDVTDTLRRIIKNREKKLESNFGVLFLKTEWDFIKIESLFDENGVLKIEIEFLLLDKVFS